MLTSATKDYQRRRKVIHIYINFSFLFIQVLRENFLFSVFMGDFFLCLCPESGLNGSVESSGHESKYSLNFEYETLDKATNHFKDSMKLGQGGAGSVFKGILPNGKTVAVKRLFFNTRQWVDQFFNEVNLISGIQHKNLVALMGCSIEGPESLLVYEYVPNRSLDQILFGN